MSKVILKCFISILVAGLIFFGVYFWNKNIDELTFFIWGVVAFILGYYLITPLIIAKKNMIKFEAKVDAVLKRFKM
ncbi:hypothetical protein [Neobacillus sp. PS2-9]|uniref:hypothetical protein n=1 Tax=Neobacillus sp. PS2-9 TaxID=3070676 RepID=UPI0027DFACB0|nr:hypothetical protein [Neobacillus sp. PS2-9]WML55961.1 hypothetical protein RCG25_13485 [Neobacillus sp. PS2-9]